MLNYQRVPTLATKAPCHWSWSTSWARNPLHRCSPCTRAPAPPRHPRRSSPRAPAPSGGNAPRSVREHLGETWWLHWVVPSCIEKHGISMMFNWDFMGSKQGMWICSATRCWSLCSKANHPQLLPPKSTIRNGPNKILVPHPQTFTAPQGFRNSGSLVRVLQDDKPASQRRSSSSSLCRNAEVRTKPTNSASICGWNLMKFGWKMVGKA